MTSDKLENICKLLSEHNFDTNENVPDEFKCGKCRKILIVACQTRCGCRFCRSCVDEMMNNGCQFCPGITSDCKIELLSTVQLDYRVNNQISRLILKCPEEMCSYACELLEMSEHLRICGKKSVECPFYKLGCDIKKITNDKLIEHFQIENYNHNKTLIDMIDNIKNEIEELREKELKNQDSLKSEIELLKLEKLEMEKRVKNVEETLNDEIAKLKSEHAKEIQLIKTEKEDHDDQIQIALRNIWYKIDEFELEKKKSSENDKFESINTELNEKTEDLQTKFDNNSISDDIKLELIEVSKQKIDNSTWRKEIEEKINQLKSNVENKKNDIFEMMVYNIFKMSRMRHGIMSEYFFVRQHSYKLRLETLVTYNFELRILVYICDGFLNQNLSFPFKADVTIKAANLNKREVNMSITKYCEIEKPKNLDKFGEVFNFQFSELTKRGIWDSNCCIVECYVDLK